MSEVHSAAAQDVAMNGASADVHSEETSDMPTAWPACRSVEHYERVKFIDEGTYGRVFRARETAWLSSKRKSLESGCRA